MWTSLVAAALAEPWSDPLRAEAQDCIRSAAQDVFLGDGAWEPWEIAAKLPADACPLGDDALLPERARDGWAPVWALRPEARLSGGDGVPDGLQGDEEDGLVTGRVGFDGALYSGPFVLALAPAVELGVAPGAAVSARVDEAWLGARGDGWFAGFGKRDRWLGPGRHGALLLSDNALPPWLGTAGVDGHLPGGFTHLGRFRVEAGAGWLDAPRGDVDRPGLLLMDLRWLPIPWVELGATRMALFGGVGRPAPDIGQLLLPTEPHVYDDPDHLLPDQDEIAALDARITLPLRAWTALPVDYVEGYWQYGGEDVIARKIGPIPYPSLAGVGNLYGGAVKVGPVVVSGEYTRLLDDYFRWYVGHRVYHDGFTQDDRVLGHWGGPDSETMAGALAWEGTSVRARLWGDYARRVGVIGTQNDRVFAFMAEEHALRIGADGGWRLPHGGWLVAGYAYEHVTGEDFVPDAVGSHHRVYVEVEPGRVFGGRVTPAG